MTPDRELATTFALAVFALASLACGTDTPSPAQSATVPDAAGSSGDQLARPHAQCDFRAASRLQRTVPSRRAYRHVRLLRLSPTGPR